MKIDRFIKPKDYVHICPFCGVSLAANADQYYINRGQKGYECIRCYIPDAQTESGKPFSRYNIGVMENFALLKGDEQLIVDETFYINYKDNEWYTVHNDLAKGQTVMVLTEPARQEHVFYAEEKPRGLIWISELTILPFVNSWNLIDQEGTLQKIRTYLLFT
jgi:hypothetical protein